METGIVTEIDDDLFDEVVNRTPGTILVEFWADWCRHCRAHLEILEQLAAETNGDVRIVRVQIDRNEELPHRFGIRSVPTLLVFRNGRLADQLIGAAPKEVIRNLIEGNGRS